MVQQPPGGGMQPPAPPGMPTPGGRPPMRMDTSALPIADIVVAAGSFLLFIMSFFGWYKAKVTGFGSIAAGRGGPETLILILSLLLFLVAGFMVVNKMLNLVNLTLPLGIIYLGWAGLNELLTLLGIVWKPGGGSTLFGVTITMSWVVWIIALVFGAIAVVGGVMKVQHS